MDKVLIFMATYNGEEYLRVQLDSLLAQENVEVHIQVSDDCSKDNTVSILKEYGKKYPNVTYYVNEHNKRFTYNFLDNMYSAKDSDYDYYAFCDQDDYWEPVKISKAIEEIKKHDSENGCLYCSNLKVVDENLNYRNMQEDETVLTKTNKHTYLYENIATGCTIVMNKKFYQHCMKYYPEGIKLHDYWVFMVAVYTASYYYDFNGYIQYRQHLGNQIGTNKKKWTFSNMKKFIHYKGGQDHMASELIKGYADYISEEDRKDLVLIRDYKKSFRKKWKLMFNRKYRKRNNNLILKFKVLFNKM